MHNAADVVIGYHQQTKHHFHRYANSLGYMDWANQPNPFRRYAGARVLPLRFLPATDGPKYDDLFAPDRISPAPPDAASIAAFFQYSLAISAWKQHGTSRWALRVNPSSGNLHPTEGYLIAGPVPALSATAGVYHYASDEHVLEQRAELPLRTWNLVRGGFPEGTFFFALSSIHWREIWKYGERGYRYCQHDVGHAFASCILSAAHLGWHVEWLAGTSDDPLRTLLGLNREQDYIDAEREEPDLIAAVITSQNHDVEKGAVWSKTWWLGDEALHAIGQANWTGRANRLSAEHVQWDVVDAVVSACQEPNQNVDTQEQSKAGDEGNVGVLNYLREVSARQIFFQRRSGVNFDGKTRINSAQFFGLLARTLPLPGKPPWNAFAAAYVDLLLYVHRVEGVPPGLYFLIRTSGEKALEKWKTRTRGAFLWSGVDTCPAHLPLYCLEQGDARKVAAQVSCGQEIAGDGCFAVSMIAEFERPLRAVGPWMYRYLHWETGIIGQMLYLEAEASGIRATGIGCYFDDPVHGLLGLQDQSHQVLYHFTMGGAVDDPRLTTLPAYAAEVYART